MADVPGTSQDDTLYGTSDADTIHGEGGADTIVGFAGADIIDGGSGIDTIFYFDSIVGVSINLDTGRGFGGTAEGDRFTSIENVQGSNLNDTLIGGDGANQFFGHTGNDILKGGGGADGLDGGSGDDILKGGGGADFLQGGAGTDTVDYSQSPPSLPGGEFGVSANLEPDSFPGHGAGGDAQNDTFSGIENLTGSIFHDNLTGDAGVNALRGLDGNDVLDGRGGEDFLDGGNGDDNLRGGGGNDLLRGGPGADQINGEGTDDPTDRSDTADYSDKSVRVVATLNTFQFVNVFVGGVAEDTIRNIANLTGGSANDTLIGDFVVNVLAGGAGNDALDGGAGIDTLNGGAGDDLLFVDTLTDVIIEATGPGASLADRVLASASYVLTAGAGVEVLTTTDSSLTTAINLFGNEVAQTINGNSGDNGLAGRGGADTLNGGLGNDTYYLEGDNDSVNDTGGFDTLSSTVSRDLRDFAAIERGVLDGGADTLLIGNDASNQLFGNTGRNNLQGGLGNDILIGRLGRDVLRGDAGADVFDFNAVDETGNTVNTRDAIVDFTRGADTIDLSTIDANGALTGDPNFIFIGTAAFPGGGGRLRFFQIAASDQTIIEGDIDGDAAADFQIQLTGLINLTAADFNL